MNVTINHNPPLNHLTEYLNVYERSFREAYSDKVVPTHLLSSYHFLESGIFEYLTGYYNNKNTIFTTAAVKNKIIGGAFTTLNNNYMKYEIHGLYIDPEFQGNGVGTKLLVELLKYTATNTVYVDVALQFKRQQKFYEVHGFRRKLFKSKNMFRWSSWPNNVSIVTLRMIKNEKQK